MVNTRRTSVPDSPTPSSTPSHFISSRTRSARNRSRQKGAEHKRTESETSLSDGHASPPCKRACKQTEPMYADSSDQIAGGQRQDWSSSNKQSKSGCQSASSLPSGHSLGARKHSNRDADEGDSSHVDRTGVTETRQTCRPGRSRIDTLNQSLLFDQLVNSTAEAVLQEMDNINIRRNRELERLRMWTNTELENMDMYSRVKRRRKCLRRNSYGMQNHREPSTEGEEEEEESQEEEEEEEEEEDDEDDDDDDDEVDEEAEEAEGEETDRPYNLRQRKTVQRYQAPPIEPTSRKQRSNTIFDTHRSPARRSHIRRKKHAIHSSDTTSSSDEERFERRKAKSMARARNRCLPVNLRAEDLASGILRERVKVGASLADVDPMIIDTSVRFDSIGGLSHHIRALKEMVVFPLLYPEVFERFKIQPPRGCLFYGPPGTGKTLVARALANECSQGEKKVAFFMRKGADCLSKWVGESERQLRLLFDQAHLMRPSIIFFDEIDGLAPVRSSRQDQIHSSIVSTLLALMDGLDSRGEIIIIGATNRLDSIDPALRRPGRFDREFLFTLPDKKARKHILQIHTRDWNPKLSGAFLEELAEKCVGYCGADIKALCTEAALTALRRRYPQIYASSQKLQLDVSSVIISAQDFYYAMRNIVPASQRAAVSPGQALSPVIKPLLQNTFNEILKALYRVFPHAEVGVNDKQEDISSGILDDIIWSDDEDAISIYDTDHHPEAPKTLTANTAHKQPFLHFTTSACCQPTSYRPRLLLSGEKGSGQSSHLAPALLHCLEKFSIHRLDLPALYSVSAKTPEESCAQIFREARRAVPSIVYMPHIGEWWEAISETLKATFLTLLQDIPSFSPILLLATAEMPYGNLHEEVKHIFSSQHKEVIAIRRPSEEDRRRFFRDLILNQVAQPPPRRKKAAVQTMEELPLALPPAPRQLSEEEKRKVEEQEENTLRELRLFLRDVTKRLATDKRFNVFSRPVDIEEITDYLEVIKEPMDLSTIMTKIDKHQYLIAKDFLKDVDLICTNALEYNPDKEPGDKIIRHRACTLKDTAHAIIAAELDPEFNRLCEEIRENRKKRGIPVAAEEMNSHCFVTRKADNGDEDSLQTKQGGVADPGFNSASNWTHKVKKRTRRRSQWGRGIIKKKKYYFKKEGDDGKNDDDHNEDQGEESEVMVNGDIDLSTDCHKENGEETEDFSLTNDESSCDFMDGDSRQIINHDREKENGHIISTEEENSNEPTLVSSGHSPSKTGRSAFIKSPLKASCLNGDISTECLNGDMVTACRSARKIVAEMASSQRSKSITGRYHKSDTAIQVTKECHTVRVNSFFEKKLANTVIKSCTEDSHCVGIGKSSETTDIEALEDHAGGILVVKHRRAVSGQPKFTTGEQIAEESTNAVPPLVVDHDRLKRLLDLLVKKSNSMTVDQLERLYGVLSQCIYRHRKDYNKLQLTEELERTLHTFL